MKSDQPVGLDMRMPLRAMKSRYTPRASSWARRSSGPRSTVSRTVSYGAR